MFLFKRCFSHDDAPPFPFPRTCTANPAANTTGCRTRLHFAAEKLRAMKIEDAPMQTQKEADGLDTSGS